MPQTRKKNNRIAFQVNEDVRFLLDKLTKIHDRSMTGVIEQLIKKEARVLGLMKEGV